MTMPNGPSGVDNNYYGATAGGSVPGMKNRTQGAIEGQLKSQVGQSQGWNGASGTFFSGILSGFGSIGGMISNLFSNLTGVSGGSILDVAGYILGIKSQAQLAKEASDSAAAQAQGALTAAQAADRKVSALLQGGVRTVYTSNTTWTKPAGLVKLGVLLYGGGRRGTAPSFSGAGGAGGGVIFAEFTADVLPASVNITIGGGSSDVGTPSLTSFGDLLNSGSALGGQLQNSTLLALAPGVFPGSGGSSGAAVDSSSDPANNGTSGTSTTLASGGAGGTRSSPPGQAGGNASVTGQFLTGGGGGGGGLAINGFFSAAGNGGAGGFPGGGGGAAGRNRNEAYWLPGFGAPGLCALIEFTQAAA